jgi:hypothetical protein
MNAHCSPQTCDHDDSRWEFSALREIEPGDNGGPTSEAGCHAAPSPPMPSVFNSARWPTTRAHADAGDAASRGIVVAAKQLAILAASGSAASEISLRRASLRRKIAPQQTENPEMSAYMRKYDIAGGRQP